MAGADYPYARAVNLPKLDYFNDKVPFCNQIKNKFSHKFYSQTAVAVSNEHLEFVIPKSLGLYSDLSSLKLVVRGRILNNNGAALNIANREDVCLPKSHFLRALWSHVQVYLNETPILFPHCHYSIHDAIHRALNSGYELQDSAEFFERLYFDPQNATTDVHLVTVETVEGEGENAKRTYALDDNSPPQLKRAYQDTKDSKMITVIGNILPPSLRDIKLLPNEVCMKILLRKNCPEFYLFETTGQGGTANHRFEISEAYVELDQYQLREAIASSINTMLRTTPAYFPYRLDAEYPMFVLQGSTEIKEEKLYLDILPERVTIAVMKLSAYNGHSSQDPHVFYNHGVKTVDLIVDKDSYYGHNSIRTNFNSREGVAEAYYQLIDKIPLPAKKEMTVERFRNSASLFVFDLVPGATGKVDYPMEHGTLGLHIRFENGVPEPLVVLMLTSRRQVLAIKGSDRHVECLY